MSSEAVVYPQLEVALRGLSPEQVNAAETVSDEAAMPTDYVGFDLFDRDEEL